MNDEPAASIWEIFTTRDSRFAVVRTSVNPVRGLSGKEPAGLAATLAEARALIPADAVPHTASTSADLVEAWCDQEACR